MFDTVRDVSKRVTPTLMAALRARDVALAAPQMQRAAVQRAAAA
jgi:hypothetical protein